MGQPGRKKSKQFTEASVYNDPTYDLPPMPGLGPERDVAFAVRDYILGSSETLEIPFDQLADFSAVYAGAKLAMYSTEYLSNGPASLRLQDVMNAIEATTPHNRSMGGMRNNHLSAVTRSPLPSHVEHLNGPVMTYIMTGEQPPLGVYDPRRVQKVLGALAGTVLLEDKKALARFIKVQKSLAVAPGVHDFDGTQVGRYTPAPYMQRPEWSQEAACKTERPTPFFPDKGSALTLLLETCVSCARINDCLELAVVNKEHFGFWGGMSERGRRKIIKLAKSGASLEVINARIAKARGTTEGMADDQLKRLIARLIVQPDEEPNDDMDAEDGVDEEELISRELAS